MTGISHFQCEMPGARRMDHAERTFHILTFGCKVNQYETQALREAWLERGGRETGDPAFADVVLLNTCAITANAVREARQTARRLHRECPGAEIVITGCAAEAAGPELAALPGVARVVSQKDKASLLRGAVLPAGAEKSAPAACFPAHGRAAPFPPFRISGFLRSRPVLKVQDGCSHGCAYCIVPLTRGPSRSRDPGEVLEEARRLLDAGFREIMLSGINLRHYACPERNCPDFWGLLRFLERELAPEWSGRARLRVSSLEPGQLDARGLEVLAGSRLLCPHLHISLQSGSADVLGAMRRGHYTPDQLVRAVERVASFWPRFGLGADILMGFPGETQAHVAETLDLVSALPFTYAHVFPFSARPGTLAARQGGQIPVAERQRRAERVRAAVEVKRQRFFQALLAEKRCFVAPEGEDGQQGVNEYYVPCRLAEPVPSGTTATGRALIPARPVAVVPEAVLVVPEV